MNAIGEYMANQPAVVAILVFSAVVLFSVFGTLVLAALAYLAKRMVEKRDAGERASWHAVDELRSSQAKLGAELGEKIQQFSNEIRRTLSDNAAIAAQSISQLSERLTRLETDSKAREREIEQIRDLVERALSYLPHESARDRRRAKQQS